MITAGEIAIQERLRAAADAGVLGYKWATLDSYPAEWDTYFAEKQPRSPGAWVVFAGMREGEAVGFGGLRAKAHFGLVVMAESARNETAQRHGGPTPAEPGSYQLIEDAIALLQGQDLDVFAGAIEVRGVHVVRSREIVKARKISMMALELVAPLSFDGAAPGAMPRGTIDDFATFDAKWHVGRRPDTTDTDAEDRVTLETAS